MSSTPVSVSALTYAQAQAQLLITLAAIAAQQQSNATALASLGATRETLLAEISTLLVGVNPYGNPALVAAQASLAATDASIAAQAQSNATTLTPLLQTAEVLRGQISLALGATMALPASEIPQGPQG
jgi:hypothetical protein